MPLVGDQHTERALAEALAHQDGITVDGQVDRLVRAIRRWERRRAGEQDLLPQLPAGRRVQRLALAAGAGRQD
jgi:hypothetical protein